MKKYFYVVLGMLLVGGFLFQAVTAATKTQRNQKIDNVKVQLKDLQIDQAEKNIESLKKQLQDAHGDKQKIEELNQKILEQDKALESALQAKARKAEELRIKAEKVALAQRTALGTSVASAATSEGCDVVRQIMSSKGFSGAELEAAVKLSQLESGCRTDNNNPSSNACNFFQEWPCGKWGGNHNTEAHINGAIGYMQASYGSWQNALYKWHSRSPHWW